MAESLVDQVINMEKKKLYTRTELEAAFSAGEVTGSEKGYNSGYLSGFYSSCCDVDEDDSDVPTFEDFITELHKEQKAAVDQESYMRNR